MDIIEVEHLKKSFGSVKAVDDISFSVRKGEFFAFLGVNGAGKSTTISILCGKLSADEGQARINGKTALEDPEGVRREIGVVFQDSVLDRSLSVKDNLKIRAALYGIGGEAFKSRLEEIDSRLKLSEFWNRPVGKLSGGQRRRADVARALLHAPNILILDEPTTGLDPQTRKRVWDVVHALRKERGITVFLTTHYMEEAADADRVVIIDGGKILANDTPLALKNKYTGDAITVYGEEAEEAAKLGLNFQKTGDGVRIFVKNTEEATELILAHPSLFKDYEIVKGRLDDVFLAVTGKRGGDV